jgi:flagellar motor switch protein FliM
MTGISGEGGSGRRPSVMEQIIESAINNYERLPMLDVIFERMVLLLTTSLRQFSSVNVDVSISRYESMRFQDAMDGVPSPCVLGIIKAETWDSNMIVALDGPCVYGFMDVLLGGRKTKASFAENRNFTNIERKMAERVIRLIMMDMAHAFEPITRADFTFDRIENNPQFAAISQPTAATIRAQMNIEIEQRKGVVQFLIPYTSLESIRNQLSQMFVGEKFGKDEVWEGHLRTEVQKVAVEMTAVFHELDIPLGKIREWDVGSVVELGVKSDEPASLFAGGIRLFEGKMGAKNGMIAVRIDNDLENMEALIDGLTPD